MSHDAFASYQGAASRMSQEQAPREPHLLNLKVSLRKPDRVMLLNFLFYLMVISYRYCAHPDLLSQQLKTYIATKRLLDQHHPPLLRLHPCWSCRKY